MRWNTPEKLVKLIFTDMNGKEVALSQDVFPLRQIGDIVEIEPNEALFKTIKLERTIKAKFRLSIRVSSDGGLHIIGDENCSVGWCGDTTGYPKPCQCGGFIHADWGDENSDGDYWLYEKCDQCGENYKEAESE